MILTSRSPFSRSSAAHKGSITPKTIKAKRRCGSWSILFTMSPPSTPKVPARTQSSETSEVNEMKVDDSSEVTQIPTPPPSDKSDECDQVGAHQFVEIVKNSAQGFDTIKHLKLSASSFLLACKIIDAQHELRGFFEDKFRYDYDSSTQELDVHVAASHEHEALIEVVSSDVKAYLVLAAQSIERPSLQDLVDSIRHRGSQHVSYEKDAEYSPNALENLERPLEQCDDATTPETRVLRPRPTSNTALSHAERNHDVSPTSSTASSAIEIKHWIPDNA